MSPTTLADLQEAILDRAKAAGLAATGRMPTDRELADVAGVDASIVSHWRRGRREAGLAELVRLVDRYGADVPAPLQERGNHVPAPGPREVLSLAVDATAQQAALTASLHAALADGRLTDEEHAGLVRQLDQAEATSHRVRLALRRRAG